MKSISASRALRGMAVATAMFCLIPALAQAQSAESSKMPPAPAADSTAQVIEIHKGTGDVMPPLGTKTLAKAHTETPGSAATAHEYTVAPGEETHPPIRLTPDRTEMIALDDDVGNIIIGNPAHLNILLSNSRTLLLAPRQPGATQFTALNAQGKVIMRRHVIVSGPKENYIRIRRTCTGAGAGCQPTSVYYCPDICHDVQMLAGQGNASQAGAAIPAAPTEGNAADDTPEMDGTVGNNDSNDGQVAPADASEDEAGGEDSSDAAPNE